MREFRDWSITKPEASVFEDNGDEGNEVYIESGAPKYVLYDLIKEGKEIFVVPGQEVKELRDELGWEKTDENDALVIKELFNRTPDVFVQFSKPKHTEIVLSFLMGKYSQITKDIAGMKNRRKAIKREFGKIGVYDETIKLLEKEKAKLLKQSLPLLTIEINRIKHIKGVGPALTVGLLSVAHPRNFPTKSRYLAYCGYKGHTKETHKFNRQAKSRAYLMAKETIMHKDPEYYPFYKKIKGDLKERFPEYPPYRINNMAINRIATFILKEIWEKTHNVRLHTLEEFR